MPLFCDYGCGQEALVQLKNGKWSCSKIWSCCPANKKKTSERFKGRTSPNKGIIFSPERRKAISEGHKGLTVWNKGRRVLDVERIKSRYPFFYLIEKPIEKDGKIFVKCKFCREYFTPSVNQLAERIRALEKNRDNSEQHFYCSNNCKSKCPVYYSKPVFDKSKKNYPTEQQLKIFREIVLSRDNYKCRYCGEKAVHVHHIYPVKNCPEFSLDVDYGLSVCHKCHNIYAHKDECSFYKIAYKGNNK